MAQVQQRDSREEEEPAPPIPIPTKMVLWRGNQVTEREAKALRHVFDNLQDHFGHQRPDPRIRFSIDLTHPGHGEVWEGDLDFTYDINGEHCNLAYFGMDVCVDLTPKLVHFQGQPMLKDYGHTWVYIYLPQLTFDKVISYVKAGTGYDVSTEGIVEDPNRNLVAIEAKLYHEPEQPKPSFWAVREKDDASGKDVSFSRMGSVQEVNARPEQQRVHRGVGIFSISMEVEGTPNFMPAPGTAEEATLSFTLVSVRTWGITDCVAPIVHAPDKRF